MKQNVGKVLKWSSWNIEKINKEILKIEVKVHTRVKRVQAAADKNGIKIEFPDGNYMKAVKEKMGMAVGEQWSSPIPSSWRTCRRSNKMEFFYIVRNWLELDKFQNIEIKKDTIKMTRIGLGAHEEQLEMIPVKRYQNGKTEYKKTDELLELIDKMQQIYNNLTSGR